MVDTMVTETDVAKNRLRELREERKLTQQEVAILVGRAQITVSRHENGQQPLKIEDIDKYCRLYKIEPHELFVPGYHVVESDTHLNNESL